MPGAAGVRRPVHGRNLFERIVGRGAHDDAGGGTREGQVTPDCPVGPGERGRHVTGSPAAAPAAKPPSRSVGSTRPTAYGHPNRKICAQMTPRLNALSEFLLQRPVRDAGERHPGDTRPHRPHRRTQPHLGHRAACAIGRRRPCDPPTRLVRWFPACGWHVVPGASRGPAGPGEMRVHPPLT